MKYCFHHSAHHWHIISIVIYLKKNEIWLEFILSPTHKHNRINEDGVGVGVRESVFIL